MKQMRWVLTNLAFFIVAVGFATDFPKMNVVPVETDKAIVKFESSSPTLLEITICNCTGEIVYFKRTEKGQSSYQKMLDFSELGSGVFNVCVNYGNRSISRKVKVSKKEIKVHPPERFYEPYICVKNEKLTVSFYNMAGKNVFLNLYKYGEHISGLRLGKEIAIQKCLDLSNLEKGEYMVVLTDCFKKHRCIVQI